MAKLTVVIDFKINTGQASRQLGVLDRKISDLSVGGIAALGLLKQAFTVLGREIINATKTSIAFEKSIAEVSTISDIAVADLERITVANSRAFGGTLQDQARGLYQTISSGITSQTKATSLLVTANKLAIAGVTDVRTATDGLTIALNAFGAKGLTAKKAGDALFSTVRDARTTVAQLSNAVGLAGDSAAASGVKFNEMLAAIGSIAATSSPQEAATRLNSIFAALQKQAPKSIAEAERLGIAFTLTAVRAQGLGTWLQSITTNAKRTDSSLIKLFGRTEAVRGVLGITAEEGKRYARMLDNANKSTGDLDEATEKMTKTAAFQLGLLSAAYERLQIAVGKVALSAENVAHVERFTKQLDALGQMANKNASFFGILTKELVRFSAVGLGLSSLDSFLDRITKGQRAIDDWVDSMIKLNKRKDDITFTSVRFVTEGSTKKPDEALTKAQKARLAAIKDAAEAERHFQEEQLDFAEQMQMTSFQRDLDALDEFHRDRAIVLERHAQATEHAAEAKFQTELNAEIRRMMIGLDARARFAKKLDTVLGFFNTTFADALRFTGQAVAGAITTIADALANGKDIGAALGQFFGSMFVQLGSALIAEGTALALLSIFNPAVAPQAAAFLGAGAVLIATGAALGAASGGSIASTGSAGFGGPVSVGSSGGSGSRGFDSFDNDRSSQGGRVVNLHFYRPTTNHEVTEATRRAMDEDDALQLGGS